MRVNNRYRFWKQRRKLGRRRSVLAYLWAPLSGRERTFYGTLVLLVFVSVTTAIVRATISEVGSLYSIPATICQAESGWNNPRLAAGQPNVGYGLPKAGIQETNSSTTEDTQTITCSGFPSSEHNMTAIAVNLSILVENTEFPSVRKVDTSETIDQPAEISPVPEQIGSQAVAKIDSRELAVHPNATDIASAPTTGILQLEISYDSGASWEVLHIFGDEIVQKAGPHAAVLLPVDNGFDLSAFEVRLTQIDPDSSYTVLLDAISLTYEVGRDAEVSLKTLDGKGQAISETTPVVLSRNEVTFEVSVKSAGDGIVQGVASNAMNVVTSPNNRGSKLLASTVVVDENGKVVSDTEAEGDWQDVDITNTDKWDVTVDLPRNMNPGKYSMQMDVITEDGIQKRLTQDFLWGVLALNTDKSTYATGDTGRIDISVLDERGKTICDAELTLQIRGAQEGTFTTQEGGGISTGEQCEKYGDHVTPDYFMEYTFDSAGEYELSLTAVTKNGTYQIVDGVTASEDSPFTIKRTGPTRIFPPVNYTMEFEVTARDTFVGSIKEQIPAAFDVYSTGSDSFNTQEIVDDTKILNFPVQILAGETISLRYQFKAPDISPEFYLLGPAKMVDSNIGDVYEESRQWQLAGDAVGRMILFYDGATIPSGWTCISCNSGDDFYQTFVRGAATYGGTGGAATHTHTASGSVSITGNAAVGKAQSGTVATNGHSHTFSPIISSSSNLPSYRQLKMIRYNTTGEPATLPAGVIAVFDNTVPTGWTQYSAQNGYYIRGESTAGTTGGSNTHTHTITGTTGTSTGGNDRQQSGQTQVGVATSTHDHTVSGTSAPASNEPSYIEVILGKLDSAGVADNDMIAMWDDVPATGWNSVSGAGGDLNNRFLKAAATYGSTGGADTHTHSDTNITSGVPNQTTSTRSGTSAASSTHTHSVTVSSYSSENHLPPYREAIFAKRAKETTHEQSAYRFYANDNSADVGTPLAAQDTAATAPSQGTPFRLRIDVHVSVLDMPINDQNLKLQFAQRNGTCDTSFTGETYTDVSPTSGDIRFYDNSSPADGNALTTNTNDPTHSSDTVRAQTYEESNNFINSQTAVSIGEDAMWDFSLVDHSAQGNTSYCFRILKSSGAQLLTYTVIPEITTAPPPPSMILLFDGAVIPSGWTCISCNSGDEAYRKFIRGAATGGGTGGSATHTHTASGSVGPGSTNDGRNNNGSGLAENDHGHTFTPTIGAASNLPSYRQLKLIKYNSGTPGTIPSGAIALFDAAVPSGWTQYSAQNGYFVRGEGTAGTTGGSNTHTNTITGTTSGSTGGTDTVDSSGTQENVAIEGHTHTVSGTTDSVDIQPPFIETILAKANSDTSIPGSMISMWDQNPGGTWTCLSCTGTDPFYQTFFKPATTYGTTGGSATHTHANTNITSSGPDQTVQSRAQSALAGGAHTHNVSITNFSTDNHLPEYIEYVFAKSASTNTAPNSPTSPAQTKTDLTNLTVGSWTNESTIIFSANLSDPDNPDTLALCVEIEPLSTSFDGVNTACGDTVSYTGTAMAANVTIASLSDGTEYHWQARTKDGLGAYSSWVSFGGNAESARDVAVDSSGPTGTVYDGTTTGVDIDYNNGNLNELSANWNIDASVSGLVGYDYSIGTTPAATDVLSWTANGTTASATATSLSLNTSQPYYFNVRTTDNAGSQSIISSDGIFIAPTLSFISSPNVVTFDLLGAGNNFTSTRTTTLTTSTNAYNGYEIRSYATGLLTSEDATTISMFNGGSYAAPDEWQIGDLGYGYTSNDTTIQGSNIFNNTPCPGGGNPPCYAPFSLTAPGDIVADHTATISGTAIVNENFIVTHRVTTDGTQAQGAYSTTVIFTITARY